MLLVEAAIVLLKDPHRAAVAEGTVMPLMYHLCPTGLNHHQPTFTVVLKDPHRVAVGTVMPPVYHSTGPLTGLKQLILATFAMMVLNDPHRVALAVDTVMHLVHHPTGPSPTGLNQLLLATFTMYSTI